MNIFPMLPILTLLLCNCSSVASPQSNSQTSSFRFNVRDELLLVKDGIAERTSVTLAAQEEVPNLVSEIGCLLRAREGAASSSTTH